MTTVRQRIRIQLNDNTQRIVTRREAFSLYRQLKRELNIQDYYQYQPIKHHSEDYNPNPVDDLADDWMIAGISLSTTAIFV